eukprot:TRINITY_DN88528_c0_g1_i1.p1 TRINITY_DN88528_c0_g1~~TRINITY_DN88528_c0_g1_i1.p1  ORF type:complete len:581 (+),score=93.93 TRINITY_DN88528_c0_g1_i1:70-1812(+)
MVQSILAGISVVFITLCPVPSQGSAEGFTAERKSGSLRASVDAANFQAEIRNAMGEALGCGGHVTDEKLQNIELDLTPIYRTLPKNAHGRIERRSLRHLAHRYFNQKSSLVIRGFEPSRAVNDSSWGSAEILSERVPGFVEAVLESRHVKQHGFDVRDAAYVIATIEQLVFDSEGALLTQVYERQQKPLNQQLDAQGLGQVLEHYLVHWLMGDDQDGINMLLTNRSLLETSFPHWDILVNFLSGEAKTFQYERMHAPTIASSNGYPVGNALAPQYSFDEAHTIVGSITKSFGSFWESECIEMKESLFAMDPRREGRVPLAKFYGTGMDAEWRFGESESYLRELGALDETSSRGKQVIIPNYIQAASNCIVATPHYMVCCHNDCNPIVQHIEMEVKSPSAEPEQLFAIVKNMTSVTSIDDEVAIKIDSTLKAQLESIASTHGGSVPLHSRLFLQWLHYVFPRECPFPHKSGTVSAVAPLEYSGNYVATKEEMWAHASVASSLDLNTSFEHEKEELQWMSQWSEEEELIAGYESSMDTSWRTTAFFALLILASVTGAVSFKHKGPSSSTEFLLPTHRKVHVV